MNHSSYKGGGVIGFGLELFNVDVKPSIFVVLWSESSK